ncbi:MAG: PAS domain-containing protein [Myxococcota bacterium]
MTGAERSLLSYLEVPVLVGDPAGRTVYVNPTFEERFGISADAARGAPLAQLFEGGGREAVLRAVAGVLEDWESVRFRLRERNLGFAAIASPIIAGGENVGVVMLLKDEVDGMERLFHLQRQLEEAVADLDRVVDGAAAGGEQFKVTLDRVRQWSQAIRHELQGEPER